MVRGPIVEVELFRGAVFFFSSRRRHTRSKRDWSSDVCSSDLLREDVHSLEVVGFGNEAHRHCSRRQTRADEIGAELEQTSCPQRQNFSVLVERKQIGRASCRERMAIRRGRGGLIEEEGSRG